MVGRWGNTYTIYQGQSCEAGYEASPDIMWGSPTGMIRCIWKEPQTAPTPIPQEPVMPTQELAIPAVVDTASQTAAKLAWLPVLIIAGVLIAIWLVMTRR